MKRCTLISLLMFSVLLSAAQNRYDTRFENEDPPQADNRFGEGGTVVIRTKGWKDTDGNIDPNNYSVKRYYYDGTGELQEIVEVNYYAHNYDSTVIAFCDGSALSREIYRTNNWDRIQTYERILYGRNSKKGHKREVNLKTGDTTYYNLDKQWQWVKVDPVTASANLNLLKNVACCKPSEFEVAAKYSYLHSGNGSGGLSMPLGFNISATYSMNPRTAWKIDLSSHFANDGDRKFDRQFILGGLQYSLRDCDRDAAPSLFSHVMVGYGRDGFRFMSTKNSGGGFAIAAGGGINLPFNDKISFQIQSDARSVFLNGGMNTFWAIGVGLKWDGGCGFRSPSGSYDYFAFPPLSY